MSKKDKPHQPSRSLSPLCPPPAAAGLLLGKEELGSRCIFHSPGFLSTLKLPSYCMTMDQDLGLVQGKAVLGEQGAPVSSLPFRLFLDHLGSVGQEEPGL